MNARQARAEGLSFTGVWERLHKRADVAKEAKEIRKIYKCRAVVVNKQGGVAVYADEKYFDLQYLTTLKCHLRNCPAKRQRILEQLAELDEEEKRLAEKIAEIETKYGIGERKAK